MAIISIKKGSVIVTGTAQLPGKTAAQVGSLIRSNFKPSPINDFRMSTIIINLDSNVDETTTLSNRAIAGIVIGSIALLGIYFFI